LTKRITEIREEQGSKKKRKKMKKCSEKTGKAEVDATRITEIREEQGCAAAQTRAHQGTAGAMQS
jgi:hypothetical protein